jgi:hypothetical protein
MTSCEQTMVKMLMVMACTGLYMANYNLVIPIITELCRKIGVPNAMVGIIIGCCDIATIPGTVGVFLLPISSTPPSWILPFTCSC